MNCPYENRIQMFLDGVLSKSQAGKIQEHIAGCAKCKAVFDALGKVDSLVRMESLAPPRDDYWNTLGHGLWSRARAPHGRRNTKALPWFWIVAHAAALFIVVTACVFLHTIDSASDNIASRKVSIERMLSGDAPSFALPGTRPASENEANVITRYKDIEASI